MVCRPWQRDTAKHVAQGRERGVDTPLQGTPSGKIKAYPEGEGRAAIRAPPCAEPGCHLPVCRPAPEGPGSAWWLGNCIPPRPECTVLRGVISPKIPVRLVREPVLTAVVSGHPGKSFSNASEIQALWFQSIRAPGRQSAGTLRSLPDARTLGPAQASLGPQKDARLRSPDPSEDRVPRRRPGAQPEERGRRPGGV